MIDRTLLLSNYLGNSFLQTEQPPKSEFPSHSSLPLTLIRMYLHVTLRGGLRVSQDAPGAGGGRGAVQLRGVMGNFIRSHNYTECWQLRGYAASTRP